MNLEEVENPQDGRSLLRAGEVGKQKMLASGGGVSNLGPLVGRRVLCLDAGASACTPCNAGSYSGAAGA